MDFAGDHRARFGSRGRLSVADFNSLIHLMPLTRPRMRQMVNSISPAVGDLEDAKLPVRRWVVFLLNIASMIIFGAIMAKLVGSRGWSIPTTAFLILYLLGLPWTLLGFWNAVIGFVILRLVRDPVSFTNPAIRLTPADSPITTRTAICLAVRHEDVDGCFDRLRVMIESLEAS